MRIREDCNKNLIQFTFWIKDVFSLSISEVDFVLKIKDNLYFYTLFWLEIKHKTRHCQGQNSSIFVIKMYKEKFIKSKIVTFRWEKMNKAVEKNTLKIMITRF